MGMNPVIVAIAAYLLLGVMLLAIFDLATKRIRTKFVRAISETQSRLAASGSYAGGRVASALFLGAMWLFWPLVFIGALIDKKEGSHGA